MGSLAEACGQRGSYRIHSMGIIKVCLRLPAPLRGRHGSRKSNSKYRGRSGNWKSFFQLFRDG
jgi:hypothetical protein